MRGAQTAGHPYHNLLICLEPYFSTAGHSVVDFIEFFSEMVGDPALPIGAFGSYFIEQSAPQKYTAGHLPV